MKSGVPYIALISLIFLLVILSPSASKSAGRIPVWIDTDPACGLDATDDVDDCWALLYAANSGRLDIVGISTVFGNASIDEVHRAAESFLGMMASEKMAIPAIYKGAGSEIGGDRKDNNAVIGLYGELRKRKLTILALGPLTNIALLIRNHPDVVKNINGIIAVAGNRPGNRRFFIGNNDLIHFHDLNFKKDPKAFDIVLSSKIPLTLLPFEVASKVTITPGDLLYMGKKGVTANWLSNASEGWVNFWLDHFGTSGFYPFDCLAVGYRVMPDEFSCEAIPAQIKWRRSRFVNRSELQVSQDFKTYNKVTYCYDVSAIFKDSMLNMSYH